MALIPRTLRLPPWTLHLRLLAACAAFHVPRVLHLCGWAHAGCGLGAAGWRSGVTRWRSGAAGWRSGAAGWRSGAAGWRSGAAGWRSGAAGWRSGAAGWRSVAGRFGGCLAGLVPCPDTGAQPVLGHPLEVACMAGGTSLPTK
eukprot:351133-Chlamydomonas_euryale.AAC.4